MTQDERTACMVELYGEVCKKADAARILHSTAPTIRAMLADGRLDSACGGEMVDVRSIARYIPDVVYAINDKATRNRGGDAAAVVYSSGAHGTLTEGVGTVGTGTRDVHEMVAVYDCRGNGDGSTVPTLTGDHQNRVSDYTAVCVGNGQLHNISMAEQMNTLDCMHDQQAVLTSGKPPRRYIVRRLTPLECCRLQGFPDGWGDIPQKESMTNSEALFWESVLNTRNAINGKPENIT